MEIEVFKDNPNPDEEKKSSTVPRRKGLSVRPPEPVSESVPQQIVNESSVNKTQKEMDEFMEEFAKPVARATDTGPFDSPLSPVPDSGRDMLSFKGELMQPDLDESISHRDSIDGSHVLTPRDKSRVESLMNDIREKLVEISEIIEPEKHPHLLRASLKKKKRKKRSKNKGKKKK
tara:strand:+ start:25 stop:549 length:525 start_codon:yes stop_codon:yes gene_type:complete